MTKDEIFDDFETFTSLMSTSINRAADDAKNATLKWIKDDKSANDKQGIANRHHLVLPKEFNNFSAEISLSQAISIKKVAELFL